MHESREIHTNRCHAVSGGFASDYGELSELWLLASNRSRSIVGNYVTVMLSKIQNRIPKSNSDFNSKFDLLLDTYPDKNSLGKRNYPKESILA